MYIVYIVYTVCGQAYSASGFSINFRCRLGLSIGVEQLFSELQETGSAFQRGIPAGQLGEGAAIAVSMIPFLVFATLFSYFALARRKWQQGESND